jgi:hypothetical protein
VRNKLQANKKDCSFLFVMAAMMLMMVVALPPQLAAQTDAAKSSGKKKASGPQWSVQVDKIDAADVALETSFQVAIYENLLDELSKKKVGKEKLFKQVLRSGDHNADGVPDLLILKTTVQKYTAGSETRRAVTTVTGATKLNVKTQLCTRDGKVVLELIVEGDVHFLGSNLRATHNLARNVANKIKESTLPEPSAPAKS